LFATAVERAAADTEVAIPALVTGNTVYRAEPRDRQTYLLTFSPQDQPLDWSRAPNIFSDARAAQINVGVVGWYFPYCRIFAAFLSECRWEPIYSGVSDSPTFWNSVFDQFDSLTPLESRTREIKRLRRMVEVSQAMVNDPQLGLV